MYARHRFPTEIISYAVWLYFTFPLSYRDVQKVLLYRGIDVSHEAIRAWCQKFGQQYANEIRRRRPRVGDKWHLDEMVVTINGEHYYLGRAVDQDGNVLDILMQRHRDKAAAKKFFRKLLKKQGFAPRVIVTDKLKSYGAAKRELLPHIEHRQHKGLNNRAENSHQPTRMRERRMRRFKSPGHAQRFCSSYELIRQHFHPKQHLLPATEYRQQMRQRFESWHELTGTQAAA
ncbi:IS6 family transposase [Chroococcidiopsis sp. CCMEE 29]|uniref:IS6 family transposase n=1 Tax=Chroococcidiopsis sp. CCMEE 29 TaxID=155894 RepID=UPI002020B486|nr:IS6 family transposase [Chroococcidiopsis sp. CCMEE 29]